MSGVTDETHEITRDSYLQRMVPDSYAELARIHEAERLFKRTVSMFDMHVRHRGDSALADLRNDLTLSETA